MSTDFRRLPPRPQLQRGLVIAVALWLLFLVATAYTSAATLLDRVASTDVMRAAAKGAWSGRIAAEMTAFLLAQIALHVVFAGLTWLLACASTQLFQTPREKFGRIVVGWFALIAGAVLAYNALWYPRTLIGAYYYDLAKLSVFGIPAGRIVYWAAFAFGTLIAVSATVAWWRRVAPVLSTRWLAAGAAAVVLVTTATMWSFSGAGMAVAKSESPPNVIFLGLDSLRLEELKRFGGTGLTPNLDHYLTKATVFTDTTTPAARTFSSWTAILTGRSPTITGARFNLAPRPTVDANPTIADVLRHAGYRTIYSTDEVRFANFDESYGFDRVLTPRIGASDFLIGTYNELPLATLFVNTRVGRLLFPFSYSNRGVATMFHPDTYLEWLDRELTFDEPTLLITHLTAAHWPYYTAETPFGLNHRKSPDDRPMYRIGLQTADRMFGEMMTMLERKGALRNAIVVVLSDHGEAMGLPSDSFFDQTFFVEGMGSPLKMLDIGHGQSVLSKSQYQVLLSFRTFGSAAQLPNAGQVLEYPATVEDISPTVLDYLGLPIASLSSNGHTLLPRLMGEVRETPDDDRVRFTETDLSVLPGPGGGIDEAGTAQQNAMFFMVDPTTARLHINPRYAPLATTFKERAAYTKRNLLAALPAGPYAHQYLYLDFPNHRGRLLPGRPADDDREAQQLWDSLEANYPGELRKAVRIVAEDWPRIADEWSAYAQALHDGTPIPGPSAYPNRTAVVTSR